MNWFQGCPNRLGHPQGLREQHPGGVQQESTFSLTHTYYLCFVPISFDKSIKASFENVRVD